MRDELKIRRGRGRAFFLVASNLWLMFSTPALGKVGAFSLAAETTAAAAAGAGSLDLSSPDRALEVAIAIVIAKTLIS